MKQESFIYVTYIATTVEEAWKALTDGSLTRQYWGHENVSDWRKGSKWEHRKADGSNGLRMVGTVLESSPPRRLVLSWALPENAAKPAEHSRVTFELETVADMIRLTVTHDQLESGSEMLRGITMGWPRVLSSLKSFLETGKPLDVWAGKK